MMKTINDIVEITSGFAFRSKNFKDNSDTGYPIIRIQNLNGTTTEFKYWDLDYDEKYLIYKNDILLSLSGNVKLDVWEGPTGLLNQRIIKIDPKNGVIKDWLFYLLQSIVSDIEKLSKKSIISNISVRDLKKINVKVPSVAKQKEIAKILNKAKEVKTKRQQQIEALSALKQSIFLDMFGNPNTNNKNWDEYTFKDIVNFHNELRVPIKKLDREKIQGEYPYYGATGIVDYINDYKFDGEYLLISEDGKALFHRNKPIAFIAKGQFWVNNHAHVITTENKSTLIYLKRCIELLNISNYITGIDQYKLNRSNISKIKIPLPPSDLQTQYEEKTIKINKQIKQMFIGLNQINNLYNSLMHKAFNGELFNEDIKV